MFQDNPLLAQLKAKLHEETPRVEGMVKGTDKGFGFLEVDNKTSYFIAPPQMRKVMHGDKISATIQSNNGKESAEPEALLEPMLTRFVGRVQKKDDRLSILPDHPLLKDAIPCRASNKVEHDFKQDDWAVAELRRHPLKGDRGFHAELTEFITFGDDHFAPWWVTLARHNLERYAPEMVEVTLNDGDLVREDLTKMAFVTIDSESTQDMDDALHAVINSDDSITLTIAIADPTAYVPENSELDKAAQIRAFTNYLPGFNIPMLPRDLSDDLCSLKANEVRPVLACRVTLQKDGTLSDDVNFFAANIESKGKLSYDNVSDYLDGVENAWQPESTEIAEQLAALHEASKRRATWRETHALVFKDRPDYRFILGDKGEVLDIVAEFRRTANRIVEEMMIAANLCAASVLSKHLGFGVYNGHAGFDAEKVEQAAQLLKDNDIAFSVEQLMTLEGFCQLRRQLDALPSSFLDNRIRRFQTYAEISALPVPHFGMGLTAYATWTSPIRKYGDMINHRLLKAIICQQTQNVSAPKEETLLQMGERRRFNRMSERHVGDWLYARFLEDKAGTETVFSAEIFDVNRGGMRVRLLDNGAAVFIPARFIHPVKDEIQCSQETGVVEIKGEIQYRQSDIVNVKISDVNMATRSITAVIAS